MGLLTFFLSRKATPFSSSKVKSGTSGGRGGRPVASTRHQPQKIEEHTVLRTTSSGNAAKQVNGISDGSRSKVDQCKKSEIGHRACPTNEEGKEKGLHRGQYSTMKAVHLSNSTLIDKSRPEKSLGTSTRTNQQKQTAVPTRLKPLVNVRTVADNIKASSRESRSTALNIACDDLGNLAGRIRDSRSWKSSDQRREAVRQALLQRVNELKTLLPGNLQQLAVTAFMHVEHEVLQRKYVNSQTMFGDAVSDIPRQRFWVSEDGYAWDMYELAQAITSNRGVMRNPLSKHMFTPGDVRAIVHRPLGERLAALEVNQRELRRGVRRETIEKLGKLSDTLLRDDEMTSFVPSRRAVEAFKAYAATLPAAEQKAIDMLWVPAVDTHTGMEFDMSIGEALDDALANQVCFHKVGDLLRQAARYLRR